MITITQQLENLITIMTTSTITRLLENPITITLSRARAKANAKGKCNRPQPSPGPGPASPALDLVMTHDINRLRLRLRTFCALDALWAVSRGQLWSVVLKSNSPQRPVPVTVIEQRLSGKAEPAPAGLTRHRTGHSHSATALHELPSNLDQRQTMQTITVLITHYRTSNYLFHFRCRHFTNKTKTQNTTKTSLATTLPVV